MDLDSHQVVFWFQWKAADMVYLNSQQVVFWFPWKARNSNILKKSMPLPEQIRGKFGRAILETANSNVNKKIR